MGSSKSGRSMQERLKFLREHGFVFLRHGKGDHDVWEHPEIKELAQKQKIECPPNLIANEAQPMWEQTVPRDPAVGTWRAIVKHAQWCQKTVETIKGAAAEQARHRKIKQDFLDAKQEICDWKRDTKHRLRAGLDAKPAPETYRRIDELKARL